MARQAVIRHITGELPHKTSSRLRDFILGWQDGLVNVLGVILGVAAATNDARIVIIAGLAATFAESISMMAVAYTSFKAELDFYKAERRKEELEVRDIPEVERKEIRDIFGKMGFRGSLLAKAVKHITANRKRWIDTMMQMELGLSPPKHSPLNIAAVVGASAFVGSFIPLMPFVLLPVKIAVLVSLAVAVAVLFFVGAYKARTTMGGWLRGGLEMALIGMVAALVGYGIGAWAGAVLV
ncbi:MAG: VIT1/CCC1 transporter family protein [Candidatus Aenigmatarchaeota archaeon]